MKSTLLVRMNSVLKHQQNDVTPHHSNKTNSPRVKSPDRAPGGDRPSHRSFTRDSSLTFAPGTPVSDTACGVLFLIYFIVFQKSWRKSAIPRMRIRRLRKGRRSKQPIAPTQANQRRQKLLQMNLFPPRQTRRAVSGSCIPTSETKMISRGIYLTRYIVSCGWYDGSSDWDAGRQIAHGAGRPAGS